MMKCQKEFKLKVPNSFLHGEGGFRVFVGMG